jgi:hypothetical protein
MREFRIRGRRDGDPARKHVTYANVVATLALVLALGGGTAWATGYIIVSTHQIKPSVLKSLRGNRGPRGYTGANGTNGANGAAGPAGATGSAGSNLTAETVLPSGQSESGTYSGSGALTDDLDAINLQYTEPLASPISASNIVETTSTTSNCPGQGQAARGYLCLYDLVNSGANFQGPIVNSSLPSPDPGALLYYTSATPDSYVFGTWTVTAP